MGFASLLVEDVLEIGGFKIIDGAKGIFVSAPQHKGKDKEGNDAWYDDVRFLGEDTTVRDEIYQSIIDTFNSKSGQNARVNAAAAQAQANTKTSEESKSSMGRRPLW